MTALHPIILEDLENVIKAVPLLSQLRDKTVLITGASGFIPFYLTACLLYLNQTRRFCIRVLALVRDRQKATERFSCLAGSSGLEFVVQDVCDPLNIKGDVHYILHGASRASPKFFDIDPVGTLEANVIGTRNLLHLAAQKQSNGFLFLSGGEIYGTPDHIPTKETDTGVVDPLSVRSCYAESKRMGESMCVAFHRQMGAQAVIARLFHTYGPGLDLDDGRVFADFISDIVHHRNITLTSDGTASRTFCYISDAAAGLFCALLSGARGEAYNISNDACEIRIRDLAQLLVDLFPGRGLKVVFDENKMPEGYLKSPVSRAFPCIDKARAIGFSPRVDIQEGFKRTIESYS